MTSHSTSQLKRQSAARPAHRNLLLVAASVLALNCTAAPMETEDATTPNAGILMPADGSQSAGTGEQQGSEPWPDSDASATAQQSQPDTAAEDDLDTLRHAAAMGDTVSGLQLVQDLVNRYETSGGDDYLYEAMLWIDRFHSSDLIAHSPVIGHLASTRCTHRVVRYHWLCEKAE